MTEKNTFENRFMSYGIAHTEEEVKDFILGAEETARLFFDDEKEAFKKGSEMMYNRELGEELYEEFVIRFAIGFCEGAVFQSIQCISRLIELGYSDSDIMKITGVSETRLASIREGLLSKTKS